MSKASGLKILIRHLSGSKANLVQEFPFDEREIKIGRDVSADVSYDPARDDVVSRTHAVIAVGGSEEQPTFSITDLNSANGTFVNKSQIKERTELLPEDLVALGRNGPSFIFDLEPRPAAVGGRTRILDAVDPSATRTVSVADATKAVAAAASEASASAEASATGSRTLTSSTRANKTEERESVGKGTLMGILAEERAAQDQQRKSMTRNAAIALAGLALFGVALGGGLYWKGKRSEEAQERNFQSLRQDAEEVKNKSLDVVAGVNNRLGMSPDQILKLYGGATAKVHVLWRLYDKETGRPIFHKTYRYKNGNNDIKTYKMYYKFPNGRIVPWLTLDDEGRTNDRIGGEAEGSAFVVDERGFLLTNKHLAAAWTVPLSEHVAESQALLFELTNKRKNPLAVSVIDLNDEEYKELKKWAPQSGNPIFDSKAPRVNGPYNIPDPTKNEPHHFEGRNEVLEVFFPGVKQRLAISGSLVRVSNDSDVALVKIDSPHPLEKVELLSDEQADMVSAGERVVVLGYPSISAKTIRISETVQNGEYKTSPEQVLQPYVTDGIVAVVSNRMQSRNGVTMFGADGDVIQLTINSTGKGNSGGPVFNAEGKVIGIFTYIWNVGEARGTAAVPIRYGNELMK